MIKNKCSQCRGKVTLENRVKSLQAPNEQFCSHNCTDAWLDRVKSKHKAIVLPPNTQILAYFRTTRNGLCCVYMAKDNEAITVAQFPGKVKPVKAEEELIVDLTKFITVILEQRGLIKKETT